MLPYDHVDRVGRDKILRKVRRGADDAGSDRCDDRRVGKVRRDQVLELSHEPVRTLRREIEAEPFHRDELVLIGVVGAKDRAQGTRADLMKNAKRTEGVGRRNAGSVRGQ